MSADPAINPFLPIYERYVDEASFLWVLLCVAQDQPHYSPNDIVELEQRIQVQIDGIMTDPNTAWPICLNALELQEPGEVFVAGVIAFNCGDADKIQAAVEAAVVNESNLDALASALNWVAGNLCHPWIVRFFTSKDFAHKRLALKACNLRNEDPAAYLTKILERDDCKQDIHLYSDALKIAGKFKRKDLANHIAEAISHDDSQVRFSAIFASILTGDKSKTEALKDYCLKDNPLQIAAIEIAFNTLPVDDARKWIAELAKALPGSRAVIMATMNLGDPQAVPWLIGQMQNEKLARLAGEAFTAITGINLTENDLVNDNPELLATLEDNDSIDMDADENLPIPDAKKVTQFWRTRATQFNSGERYFVGKPITASSLALLIKQGYSRQRKRASLELAICQPDQILKDVRSKISTKK